MILFSQLEGYDMKSEMGDDMGKLKDLVIDTTNWKVTNLVVSGLLKKKKEELLIRPSDIKIDWGEEKVILSPAARTEAITQDKSSLKNMYLSDLLKKHAYSSDKEKFGKVYDVEIATELKDWEVWKLLIKVGFKKRRLRIKPDKISKLDEDVSIKMTKKEVEALSHPTLG
jgi:sporulation protein YlmC with PRC-barrel domain